MTGLETGDSKESFHIGPLEKSCLNQWPSQGIVYMDIHMLVMLVFIFVTDVKAFSFITWYEFSWALHRQFFSLGNFRTSPILETHHGVLLLQSSVSFYFRSVFLVDFMFINEFEEWKWMMCLTFLFWIQLSFNWCFSYLLPISSYLLKSAFSIKMLNFFFWPLLNKAEYLLKKTGSILLGYSA